MKKIIRGKLYDTSTAKEIAEYRDLCGGDKAVNEQLYRKRSGEYFLNGSGGAASKYATLGASGWVGGSAIVPLSYEQARRWAEEHLSADEYAALFGEPSQDDGTKQAVSYSLSAAAVQRAKREASKRGISVSEYVDKLIMSESLKKAGD